MKRLYIEVNDNGKQYIINRDCDAWALAEDGTLTVVDRIALPPGSGPALVDERRTTFHNVAVLDVHTGQLPRRAQE